MADRYWVGTNTIKTFSVAAQEITPSGLFFKPDGTKMYVTGTSGDDVNEYDLSTAWDVSTASYLQNFSVAAQEANPQSIFFKPDGTKMYVIGFTGDDVNEYDLSTAWDISTASYFQVFSIAAQETIPTGVFFRSDGIKMYIIGYSTDAVYEYDLSTAWDISTASYLQNFSVSAQETFPLDIFFKPDGTKMYIVGDAGNDINEYDLSTAWDISTASYAQNFSVVAQEGAPSGVFFKDDGTVMYILGPSSDSVWQYPLSTAWDISSISPDVWDGTAGTKWAATSGGAGGASVPTTSDDVFFDANSGGVYVPISAGNTGAASINCTGFTGTIAGSAAITVAGSVTLDAGQTYTHTGTMTFTGTGTLTTAGKEFSGVTVDGAGITLTLGDALNTTTNLRDVLVTQGSFDTANYSVSTRNLNSNNSNTRTITLGSSTITLGAGIDFTNATNLTFNANTSQINFGAATMFMRCDGQTFYNVSFTSTAAGTRSISGANTFNNLTLNASATGLSQLSLAADQTVNGTFTCAGTSYFQRGFVRSNTLGTTRTITANAISANDCDFRDITIAGTAAGASPTRAGDCGGNSGITFPAAKTVYRVGGNSLWRGSSSWALTSGGAGSNDNFPLAQDTAIIDENTTYTGTLTLGDSYNLGSLDCSTRTTVITLNYASTLGFTHYGSFILGSGISFQTQSRTQTFSGRGTQTFTSAGKTFIFPLVVDKPSGAFELGDAFSSSSGITHTRGTFDANNYNLTCTTFVSNNSNTRTITMGSGLWTLSGTGTVWNTGTSTNLTFNRDTADILLSNTTTTARGFNGGGLAFNKLTIGGSTGVSVTTLATENSFTELASTKTVAHTIRLNTNQGTIDTWSITGSAGNVVTVAAEVATVRRTFTLTNVTSGIDYLNVKDIGITDADRFYVGANSIDGGNNLNVYFTDPPSQAIGNFFFLFH